MSLDDEQDRPAVRRNDRRRAVAIVGKGAGRHTVGGRGPVADAILALAAERGVQVRHDADLAEVLSAIDPAEASSEAATALTAALLDRLYRMNAALKPAAGAPAD